MKKTNVLQLTVAILWVAFSWTNAASHAQETFKVIGAKDAFATSAQEPTDSKPQSAQRLMEYSNDDAQGFIGIDVDRKDHVYQRGDKVVVTIKSSVPGYLTLFNFNPKGKATLLIPNPYFKDVFISSGVSTVYPSPEMPFNLTVGGENFGAETMKAFVTPYKLELPENATSIPFYHLNDSELEQILKQLETIDSDPKDLNSTPKVAAGRLEYFTFEKAPKPAKERRFFIGIAVGRFQDSSIHPLEACLNDVDAVSKFFKEEGGVDPERCYVLKNEEATKEKIREIFEKVRKEARPGDVVVIYITTHGQKDSHDVYITPYDGKNPENPKKTSVAEVAESLVSSNEFDHWLNDLRSCKNLLFVDACYSGGMFDQPKGLGDDEPSKGLGDDEPEEIPFFFGFDPDIAKTISSDSVYGICSSSKDQKSYMIRGNNRLSVFTNFLVDSFYNVDVRTHKDVKDYVAPRVAEYMYGNYYRARQTVVESDKLTQGVNLRTSN